MTIALDFFSWLEKQDPETPVVHNEGWDNCAVGMYSKANGIYRDDLVDYLEEHCHEVYQILNSANTIYVPEGVEPLDTMAGMVELINTPIEDLEKNYRGW